MALSEITNRFPEHICSKDSRIGSLPHPDVVLYNKQEVIGFFKFHLFSLEDLEELFNNLYQKSYPKSFKEYFSIYEKYWGNGGARLVLSLILGLNIRFQKFHLQWENYLNHDTSSGFLAVGIICSNGEEARIIKETIGLIVQIKKLGDLVEIDSEKLTPNFRKNISIIKTENYILFITFLLTGFYIINLGGLAEFIEKGNWLKNIIGE